MKAFVITYLVLNGFSFMLRFYYICKNDYPREVTYRPWEDMVHLIVTVAFSLWAIKLIF